MNYTSRILALHTLFGTLPDLLTLSFLMPVTLYRPFLIQKCFRDTCINILPSVIR